MILLFHKRLTPFSLLDKIMEQLLSDRNDHPDSAA